MRTLNKLSLAVALLSGTQASQALTPWADGAPPAANTIYVSGGAAADLAYAQVVNDVLAVPGSLHVFGDATTASSTNFGARWLVYYFTGSAATGPLAGQPIALVKRSLGAAGYGVIPVIRNIPIEELDISTLAAPGSGNTTVFVEPTTTPQTIPTARKNFRVVVTAANAGTLLPRKVSDAGILGIDAQLLTKPNTKNYPKEVPVVAGAADVFPTDVKGLEGKVPLSTGGLAYGVGITTDLYNVLQAAQKRSGQLPAATVIGEYQKEARIPSLPSNVIGSLIAGKIKFWDEVKIVDNQAGSPTLGQALSLTHPSILADAGVSLPTTNAEGKVPVAWGNRNAGAAIGAVAYATFLNYPGTKSSFGPPLTPTNNLFDATSAPIIKDPGGSTATGQLLNDWNQGTNASGLNSTAPAAGPAPKRWGGALNDGTRNTSGTIGVTPEAAGKQSWRYVRIDGYLPKIENIASGGYPLWAEGELLLNTNDTGKLAVLNALANGLASPATAANVNTSIVHTWGTNGVFALTKNTAFTTDIPFNPANPVVGFTHNNSGNSTAIRPVVSGSSRANGVLLQGLPR